MIRRAMFAAACMLAIARGSAKAVEISASVDNQSVAIGDRVVLSVRVSGARHAGAPSLPPLESFRVEGSSYSTQIQIVNGQTSMSTQYDYTLLPLKEGRFTIGPVTLSEGGAVCKTDPIAIEVGSGRAAAGLRAAPRAAGRGPVAVGPGPGERMFLELSADKQDVYLNEQVLLTFRFYYTDVGLAEQPSYDPPPAMGFVVKNLGGGKSINYTKTLEGRQYRVSELRMAIYPYQTGELTAGPAKLSGSVLVEAPRRMRQPRAFFDMDDFFGESIFGNFSRKPFQLESNRLKIRVRPLPKEGAPPGEVAVGSYRLAVNAKPVNVNAGDPITLTMTVSGEGDLEKVAPPRLSDQNGFKTYEAASTTDISEGADGPRGTKKFEQAIVPLSDKVRQIPQILFSYFDPRESKYVTLRHGPIPIRVQPPKEEDMARMLSLPSGAEKQGVKILERNIVFIKTGPGKLKRGGGGQTLSMLFWIIQCIPLAAVIIALVHERHLTRLRSDSGYARLHGAGRMTRARLKEADHALRRGEGEEFYARIVRAVNLYVADRLNIPPGGLTPEMVHERLAEKGASERLLHRLDGFFRTCELARFTPAQSGAGEMARILGEATALLEELRKCRL